MRYHNKIKKFQYDIKKAYFMINELDQFMKQLSEEYECVDYRSTKNCDNKHYDGEGNITGTIRGMRDHHDIHLSLPMIGDN